MPCRKRWRRQRNINGRQIPFFFQSEKGFDSIRPREILLWLGTHYVFVNGVFWLCLQEYPPASQAPTYPFPWGSTNERGHKPNPYDTNILPNSKLQWILLNRIFSSATVITGLTYIAFKWLWVVVLQWISHDVQFCSKGKMGSSLRFYEQFLTLAPSMNKNLCSFCSCSLLNGVSVDFQQGFRGLDSSQLAFVSTHKQLCSFPAFDTFTPDHFASNFCGLIFRISNWQLTISSWLLAENILSSEWYSLLLENLKRKAGETWLLALWFIFLHVWMIYRIFSTIVCMGHVRPEPSPQAPWTFLASHLAKMFNNKLNRSKESLID